MMLNKNRVVSFSLAVLANAAVVGNATSAVPTPVNLSGLLAFKSAIRQTYTTVPLPAGVETAIPASAATVVCKAGVAKCVIAVEIAAQVQSTSGYVEVCPIVDGVKIDDCRSQSSVPSFFVYSALAFAQKTPGTSHSVSFSASSSTGGALHYFSARYQVLYR